MYASRVQSLKNRFETVLNENIVLTECLGIGASMVMQNWWGFAWSMAFTFSHLEKDSNGEQTS